jgi:hypothetical protein
MLACWRFWGAVVCLTLGSCGGYDHINTPYFKVILTNSYENGIVGVHLKNKRDQDRAMQGSAAGCRPPPLPRCGNYWPMIMRMGGRGGGGWYAVVGKLL